MIPSHHPGVGVAGDEPAGGVAVAGEGVAHEHGVVAPSGDSVPHVS